MCFKNKNDSRRLFYLVICRTILRIMSKPGLSSGASFQHLWMSSDRGSGQSCPDMSGRKYGSSRFSTRSKISSHKIHYNNMITDFIIIFISVGNFVFFGNIMSVFPYNRINALQLLCSGLSVTYYYFNPVLSTRRPGNALLWLDFTIYAHHRPTQMSITTDDLYAI